MTREGSLVYFMGCNLAASPSGEELIRRLSGGVWRGRFVVAFRHRGYGPGGSMLRAGADCNEPGMRDGDSIGSSGQIRRDRPGAGSHPNWRHLDRLPWATHRSRSAVVAAYGHLVGSPEMPSRVLPR